MARNFAYPTQITIELPAYFNADDTVNHNNEIYFRTFVDAMGTADSYGVQLKIVVNGDGSGASSNEALSELVAKTTEAKALKESDYTSATWAVLESALNAAQKLITDNSTDTEAISKALADLTSAMDGLKKADGGTAGGGTAGGGTVSTGFFLKDGRYYVHIDLWHQKMNQASMGNVAFKNNDQALVTVSGGKITKVQIATNPVDVSGYHSAIIEIVVNGKKLTPDSTGEVTTNVNKTYDYVKATTFTMPSAGQPEKDGDITLIPVRFKVPDTPMDEGVVNTDGYLDARLRFDWGDVESTKDTSLVADDTAARGTSSITGKEVKDVDLTDKTTGIKLSATTEALSDKATLSVTAITSGSDYDTAVKAMSGVSEKWALYKVVTLVSKSETAPEGSVTLSIPCTSAGMTVYRVNSNGTKTVIKGSVKDGYYVFKTSSLGLFAVVGDLGQAEQVTKNGFKDLAGHWAESYVEAAVERGLFSGTTAITFSPDMAVTRGMFVTVLAKLAGAEAGSGSTGFKDVPADAYYAPYVAWALKNGIVAGTGEGTFSPEKTITRQEMAVILMRYTEYAKISLKDGQAVTFTDVGEISGWAADAVSAAAKAGLLAGTGAGKFAPQAKATRAEVATLLMGVVRDYSL